MNPGDYILFTADGVKRQSFSTIIETMAAAQPGDWVARVILKVIGPANAQDPAAPEGQPN